MKTRAQFVYPSLLREEVGGKTGRDGRGNFIAFQTTWYISVQKQFGSADFDFKILHLSVSSPQNTPRDYNSARNDIPKQDYSGGKKTSLQTWYKSIQLMSTCTRRNRVGTNGRDIRRPIVQFFRNYLKRELRILCVCISACMRMENAFVCPHVRSLQLSNRFESNLEGRVP